MPALTAREGWLLDRIKSSRAAALDRGADIVRVCKRCSSSCEWIGDHADHCSNLLVTVIYFGPAILAGFTIHAYFGPNRSYTLLLTIFSITYITQIRNHFTKTAEFLTISVSYGSKPALITLSRAGCCYPARFLVHFPGCSGRFRPEWIKDASYGF